MPLQQNPASIWRCLRRTGPAHVLFGIEDQASEWRPVQAGALPGLLPAGTYSFANAPHDMRLAALAFALGSYRFNRYRKNDAPSAKLVPPADVDITEITRMADAAALARDLINTPANDMGPEERRRRRRRSRKSSARNTAQSWRRPAEAEFSADPCRRHGFDPRPA
jgi:hypothetical protein